MAGNIIYNQSFPRLDYMCWKGLREQMRVDFESWLYGWRRILLRSDHCPMNLDLPSWWGHILSFSLCKFHDIFENSFSKSISLRITRDGPYWSFLKETFREFYKQGHVFTRHYRKSARAWSFTRSVKMIKLVPPSPVLSTVSLWRVCSVRPLGRTQPSGGFSANLRNIYTANLL